jgi:hypothetical protein
MPCQSPTDPSGIRHQSWPIVFPFDFGPAVRAFAAPLLWSGGLVTCTGRWISTGPMRTFDLVCAQSGNSSLAALFAAAQRQTRVRARDAMATLVSLEPLHDRIRRIAFVGPGTSAAYDDWEPHLPTCLPVAQRLLADERNYAVAVGEFVWHVHELALELSAGARSTSYVTAAEVVHRLEGRVKRLGSPDLLLAHCLLHRFSFARIENALLVTTEPDALTILENTGIAPDASGRAREAVAGQVAF